MAVETSQFDYSKLTAVASNPNTAASTVKNKVDGALNQAQFLKLMTTQMTHQDPSQPMQNGEFLTQMAQFGTVSGIQDLQKSFSDFASNISSSQALQASSLVGHSVVSSNTKGVLETGKSISGTIDLSQTAGDMKIKITDSKTGDLVKTITLGQQAKGSVPFKWDGQNDDGELAEPGLYKIEASGTVDGKNTVFETFIQSEVESVNMGGGSAGVTINLSGGAGSVNFNQVKKFFKFRWCEMGFATALSGLKAAATSLQVTGNNIANSQTTGFKESRAEFADVYASSIGGVSKTQPGSGVRTTEVAQQFNQGNIEAMQNSLDLAISGNGFFVLADQVNLPDPNNPGAPVNPSVPNAYTRNGAFQLDEKGNIINDQGRYLLTFAPNGKTEEDGFSVGVFRPIQIDTSQGLPKATENMNLKLNLNGAATAPTVTPFDPTDSHSFNHTTSVTSYDSQGNAHIAKTYYVKTATANEWDSYLFIDDFGITTGGPAVPPAAAPASTVAATANTPGTPFKLTFDSSGLLSAVDGKAGQTKIEFGAIDMSKINPTLRVDPMAFKMDFFGGTQFSTPFSVNTLNQDGLASGSLTGLDVNDKGVIFARYSNGGSKPLGQVAMARFQNNQGLAKMGDTTWAESSGSGIPLFGAAGDNNFGKIQSASLEGSNVDLSEQLVKLIIAQQAYQANAQTITTEKTIVQNILQV